MEIKLSQDEKVVKSYDYASKGNTEAALVVTTKRLVHIVKNPRMIKRDEVVLDDVTTIKTELTRPVVRLGLIIAAVAMIAVAVLAVMLGVNELSATEPNTTMAIVEIAAGAVFAILGIVLLVAGIKRLIRGLVKGVCLVIKTKEELPQELVEDYSAGSLSLGADTRRLTDDSVKKDKPVKLKLKTEVATEIVDTIGSLLIK